MTTEQIGIICFSVIGLAAVIGLFVVWVAIVKVIIRIGGRNARKANH